MNLKEFDNFSLSDAIRFHDELNPAIFDGEKMKSDVREQLLLIAEDFIDHLGVNHLDVDDITISGSSAAYTYTPHSDIDLHILVDMSKFKDDDVYRELFDAKKTIYNDQHDITINGFEVELYVQDTNKPVISLGEYSVMNDNWIKLPRKRKAHIDQENTRLKYQKLYRLAEFAAKSNNVKKIENVLRTIKKYRQAGLDRHGEFGPENLAFKILRRKGIIGHLYDKLNDLHSNELSIPESTDLLDKPDLTVAEIAKKHKVERSSIQHQLSMGIKVEMEHTNKFDVAKEIALNHLAEDPEYYTKLNKVGLEEAFDKPYKLKWEKGEHGDYDALATLDDGTYLSIMFNNEFKNNWMVEFYRNNSQEVTGEGDSQRVFATVLTAIGQFIKKKKPVSLFFSAVKEDDPKGSRARLYNTLVNRYATKLGYTVTTRNDDRGMSFKLTKSKPLDDVDNKMLEARENYNGLNLLLQKDDDEVFVKASAGSRELGHVLFVIDGDYLIPQDLEVDERYRGQGIAQTMYDYVKNKGYKIRRSGTQTDAGRGFWAKHRPEQNVWEQDVNEASGYIPSEKEKNDPRFKTALTVDVKPNSIKKNANAFGFKVSRAGIPPLLR